MLTEGAIAVDQFAELIGEVPESLQAELVNLAAKAKWRPIPGRHYDTADVEIQEPCNRAFLVRIPPNGDIPVHHDTFIEGVTHHLVIQTNDQCLNWWVDTQGKDQSIHMEQGKRYQVSRTPLHWAENKGTTDRIHLLIEYP